MTASPVEPRWRLFLSLAVMPVAIVVGTILLTLRDILHSSEPTDWHSAGGERQMVLAFAFFGTPLVMLCYIFFVVPLVLLWPGQSQLRHWYAVLASSLVAAPVLGAVLERSIRALTRELHAIPGAWLCLEMTALVACGTYLLLLRRASLRESLPDLSEEP